MPNDKTKCPKCGTENDTNNTYCENCGNNLTDRTEIKSLKKPSSTLEILSFLVFSAVFSAALGFLAICWLAGKMYNLSQAENSLQQIYNAIEIMGMEISIGVGIILAFIIMLSIRIITKLNAILIQLQEQNNK